jgi:DNA-binding response OmpR family regulator
MPAAEGTSCRPPTRKRARERGETILLIEDEPLVRDLLEVLSSGAGHRAGRGEAHRCIREIHLTVTDVVLPAMSARK